MPVRKPGRTEFIRVHPDHVLDVLLLEANSGLDRECYLVAPEVQHLVLPELAGHVYSSGSPSAARYSSWPVKLPLEGHDHIRRVSDTASRVQNRPSSYGPRSCGTQTSAAMRYSARRVIWASHNGLTKAFGT